MKNKFQMYTDLWNRVKLVLVAKRIQKNIIQKEDIFLTLTVMIKNVNALSLEQKHRILKTNGIRYTQENI